MGRPISKVMERAPTVVRLIYLKFLMSPMGLGVTRFVRRSRGPLAQ